MTKTERKPEWIRYIIPGGPGYLKVKKNTLELNLHTICTEAKCPNAGDCFSRNTAAFLILGNICTRDCLYCAVVNGIPGLPEDDEPERVAEAVCHLGLEYAVITSVTRDDLEDGGASYFSETVKKIRNKIPQCGVELLVPDFKYSLNNSLNIIIEAEPDILNHNIEIVKKLFKKLRPSGDYEHSLRLINTASGSGLKVKSGLMIGFGESMNDIFSTMRDLLENGCSILTVGQYLKPGKTGFDVKKYYHPDEFEQIKATGLSLGFDSIHSAPNVRSSYHAGALLTEGEALS